MSFSNSRVVSPSALVVGEFNTLMSSSCVEMYLVWADRPDAENQHIKTSHKAKALLTFMCIMIHVFCFPPAPQREISNKRKAWELYLSLIPHFRPSHCPSNKISNEESPRSVVCRMPSCAQTTHEANLYKPHEDIYRCLASCLIQSCEV